MRNRVILPVIFLSSASCLAYEILLARIFSISLSYHFAYLIISIAMLGISAGGTVLTVYPKLKRLDLLGHYMLALGIAICFSYLAANQIPFDPVKLTWSNLEIGKIGLYYLILSTPFFFAGLIAATAFASLSDHAGLLYGTDLIGAGAGAIGILCVMFVAAPDVGVFLLSVLILLTACLVEKKGVRIAALSLIALGISVFAFLPDVTKPRISPFKDLPVALRYPGAEHLKTYWGPFARIDTIASPASRFAPGLSFRYLDPLPRQIGLSVDGGNMTALTAVDDIRALRFLGYLPSALPYEIGNKDDILILDPQGGLPILTARFYLAKSLVKVESNPLLLDVIRDDYAEFVGGIYRLNTWPGMGRSWLKARQRAFDIIDISLMGTAPSGALGIAEDYRFTVEAFDVYLGHLKPGGMISLNLYLLPPPRTELRLLETAVVALGNLGITRPAEHIAAIRSWGSLCILVKRSPFTVREMAAVKTFASTRRFDLIHNPGIAESATNVYIKTDGNEYFHAFQSILRPEKRADFLKSYLFDVRASHDDRPFFHYYLKLENIREIYRVMGGKWQYFIDEGYILPVLFAQVVVFGLMLMSAPVFMKKRNVIGRMRAGIFGYFSLLGIGFMFAEICFIQKFILILENPAYAMAAVLTALLISSGLGSLLGHRASVLAKPAVMPAAALMIIVYSLALPFLMDLLVPYAVPLRILLVVCLILPPGILMGIPFPLGLKTLGRTDPSLIPWAWAINGCFSVLSPVLAVLIALTAGFTAVLWLGSAAYLFAFFIFSFGLLRSSGQMKRV